MALVSYVLRFQQKLYPYALIYLKVIYPQLFASMNVNKMNQASNTVLYMAMRQNYLENRI